MNNYIVITSDIIDSRKYKNIMDDLSISLENLNINFSNSLFAPFKMYRGDEIQGICKDINVLPKLIRHLRYTCKPYKIRIGIGIGTIENSLLCTTCSDPWQLNGLAFHLARSALNNLTNNRKLRKKERTYFLSCNSALNLSVNTFYTLYDITLNDWSNSQWNAVIAYEQSGTYMLAEKLLKISYQSIQKRCASAHWDEIRFCEENFPKTIKEYKF